MRYLAVFFTCAALTFAQEPIGGSGGGGGSVGTPYSTTGTATTVSITAATHGKGTSPIWMQGSCFTTATGAAIPFTAFTIAANGDVTGTWSGSIAYTCRVFASGQAGTNGTNGTNGAISVIKDETSSLTVRANLNFTGAGITCADNAGTTSTDCTVPAGTLSDGDKGDVVVSSSGTVLTLDTVTVPKGGTGLTSGTSGGVLYYSSSSALSSSALLASGALMLGGGAGGAPTTSTLTGILKATLGVPAAAVAGTDYIAPSTVAALTSLTLSSKLTQTGESDGCATFASGILGSTGTACGSGGGGGSGDVTAASSFGVDNTIIRADGTGKGVQGTTSVIMSDTGFVLGLEISDSNNTIVDAADPTKQFVFEAAGITPGATRVFAVPDLDGTLLTTNATQTVTGKSISGSQITSAVATATALAANGANCSAGSFPLGTDASGAAETCTALPTTIAGTTNEITASASTGAVVISLPSTINLSSKTLRIPNSTTLPGTCTLGDTYMDSDATTGQRFYLCESANTWALQGGGGGGSGDVTEVQGATGISVSNQTGPIPIVSVDTAVILSRAQAQSGADNLLTVTSASGTTWTATMSPTLTTYTNGMIVEFPPNATCSGTVTLNIDTLGAKTVFESDGTTAATCSVAAGRFQLYYDGTQFKKFPGGSSSSSARTVERNAGVCLSGAAGSGFSLPVSGAPTAVCVTGTNANGAVLQFPDTGSYSVQDRMILTGTTIALDVWWRANVANASLNAIWQLQTACVAVDEDGDPTWNTVQVSSASAAHATAYRWRKVTFSSVTTTGCATGEIMRYKLIRDSAHASDTLGATAELISLVWSIQ